MVDCYNKYDADVAANILVRKKWLFEGF